MSGRQITPRLAIAINRISVERFGGIAGVRDMGLLESALRQPYQSFGGADLYPGPICKACRLAFGIIKNHPFVDGNKRTGIALLKVALFDCGIGFEPAHAALLSIITGVA